ncbi:MAG TPA: DUF4397 domain-containing protein [Pedobacter sp.]|jgi:hypothetical protein
MKLTIKSAFAFLICLTALQSCTKEEEGYAGDYPDKAKVNFVNVTLNSSTIAAQAARPLGIYEYYNGVTYNTYPLRAVFANGYKVVEPGTMTMRLDTAWSPQANSIQVPSGRFDAAGLPILKTIAYVGPSALALQGQFPVAAGSYYSCFAYGTYNTPGNSNIQMFFTADDLSLPTDSKKTKVRFFNFSPDVGAIDIKDEKKGVIIATNVGYAQASNFVEIDFSPNNQNGVTLGMYRTGTTTAVGGSNATKANMIFNKNSVYTVWVSGFQTRPNSTQQPANDFLKLNYHANFFKYNLDNF